MLPSVLRGASIEAKPSGDGHHGFACATPKACVLRKPRLGALPIRASKALGSLQLHQVAPISFLCRELAVKFPPFMGTPLPQPQPMGPTQVKVIPNIRQVRPSGFRTSSCPSNEVYFPHRQVWVLCRSEKEGSRLLVRSLGKAGFDTTTDLNNLVKEIKNRLI